MCFMGCDCILFMDKTFGFDTAVEEAQRAINSAYIEVGYVAAVRVLLLWKLKWSEFGIWLLLL